MLAPVIIGVAFAWLLLLQLAGASHVVYKDVETAVVAANVPPSIVDPLLRTGYHFQPPKNWINGKCKQDLTPKLLTDRLRWWCVSTSRRQ